VESAYQRRLVRTLGETNRAMPPKRAALACSLTRVTNVASIFESGAVYYPTILLAPIVAGVALARWRPAHELLILLAVVLAFVVFDFALDDTRMDDIAFFVVLGAFMFGLGMLARAVARRVLRPRTT
jgi:sugar phosphate permease